jgi:flagellar basal body-associated protein FliL
MAGSIVVVLIVLAVAAAVAIVATVRVVVRDGRGHVPTEPSQRPWTAGNLPSQPYSMIRRL